MSINPEGASVKNSEISLSKQLKWQKIQAALQTQVNYSEQVETSTIQYTGSEKRIDMHN